MPFADKHMSCARAVHTCAKCNRRFMGKESKESFIQHLEHSSKHQITKAGVPESCGHCVRSFSSTSALLQHLENNRHHLKDLHHAACTGKFQLVEQLMRTEAANCPGDSHRPSKPQTGYTPMHCAAFGGHDECLKIMLSWPDGDPNVVDPADGRTPVHLAAWKGHGVCLKLLLRKGGRLRERDFSGKTPISLARDPSCLSLIVYYLAETEYRLDVEGSIELVWKSLCGESSPMVSSPVMELQNPCHGGVISQSNNEEFSNEPYEVLARGELAVEIFNQALREGKARISRMQLTVIGNVGVGKTSLVRSLSGEEFEEERKETHGIDTSMVEKTELDVSWHAADPNKSQVDEILVDQVCQGIQRSPRVGHPCPIRGRRLTHSHQGPSFLPRGQHPSYVRRLRSIEGPSTSGSTSASNGEQTSLATESPASLHSLTHERRSLREIPIEEIMRRLSLNSETSLGENEKKYAKISIWDFAGHSLYEAMHHVFLNRRSFYLAVLNLARLCNLDSANQVLEEINYWLNSIRVHAPHTTPVFLVGTHSGEVSEQDKATAEKTLHEKLTEKFGQQLVKSKENSFLFPVENTLGGEDPGAGALKKAIENEATRLSKMDEEFPLSWLDFEEEILKCREDQDFPPCVRNSDLKQMLEQSTSRNIDDREFGSMLQFYHDSGVIILPEELIGPKTHHSDLNDVVVVNPQYLVDVMTRLHDISDHLNIDREHQSQWEILQEHGVADLNLLEYLWKDFKSPATQLVGILEACGMLCPISSSVEDEDREDGTKPVKGDENESEISKYIVPFHLKDKCLKGKWNKLCRKRWTEICTSDKVLMFDFRSFLPPALFHHFIVRTGSRSQSSNGMRPIIAKRMAIFSFGDSFFILTEMCQKHNQIRIRARHKNTKKPHELFNILMSIMTDICQRQFRFLKFSFGPTCPNPRCPGSSSEGTVLPVDTSSDESDDGDDDEAECGERESSVDSSSESVRHHVIYIDPAVASRPLWCNSTPVHEFEEIKQWLVKPQNTVSKVPEDSPCYSKPVKSCCLALVAKELAYKWKWLGRSLSVEDTVIETIQTENHSEEERAYQVLTRWSRATGSKGTVHELMKAIQEIGDVPPLEAFDRHLGDRHVQAAKPIN